MNEDEGVFIPKEQFDLLLTKATVELIQRVNKLIELLEKNNERTN